MSDNDILPRSAEQIHITVFRTRNLRGFRGESLTASLKLEFNEKLLGESVKLECTPENATEFNFTASITCNFDDLQCLDDIANKPLLLTVTESLPKEKKQKDEKAHPLGQCTFDLYGLMKGQVQSKLTVQIVPLEGSPLELVAPEHPKPEVDIEITTASGKPLFSDRFYEECNLLKIVIESLYSPPEALLQAPTGCQITNFTAALPLAVNAEKEATVVFTSNEVKQPGAFEKVQPKKWATGVPGAQGAAQFMSDSFVNIEPYETEMGQLRDQDAAEMRRMAEQEKPTIVWNSEKRLLLLPSACKTLSDRVARQRICPVEFFRIVQVHGQKSKKDDESVSTHHGVAYVDVSPLLFPGVKHIRGAFKVVPFIESEYFEKVNRKTSVLEEALRASTQMARSGSTKGKKDEKKGNEKGKKGETNEPPPTSFDIAASVTASLPADHQNQSFNIEGQQYSEAGSYAVVDIELHRSLVPKRNPEQLAKSVSAYIPSRSLFPKRTVGAQKAIQDYRAQVAQIGDLVLEELRRMFGKQTLDGDLEVSADSAEQNRRELMYELTANGKFYAFKEQLKFSIIKIVRERFLKIGAFTDESELQAFLSDLYVYLADETHIALDQFVKIETKTTIAPSPINTAQLKVFADEARRDAEYKLSQKYFEERIAREPKSADHWFDYAVYLMGREDIVKAEQCLKECLALHQKHFDGLLLYGIVSGLQSHAEEAVLFLDSATSVQPRSIPAWLTLSLFHEISGNTYLANYALQQATRISKEPKTPRLTSALKTPPASRVSSARYTRNQEQSTVNGTITVETVTSRQNTVENGVATETLPADQRPASSSAERDNSIFMQTANHLLAYNAFAYVEVALAHELIALTNENRESCAYQIAVACLHYKRRQFDIATKFLYEAIRIDGKSANAWALLGHTQYETKQYDDALLSYEHVLNLENAALDMHLVYLRLAEIYLKKGKFEASKEIFLTACKHSPSARSWLGVGIACYRLGQTAEAEDALAESNLLNNYDPYSWAYLALVSLRSNRLQEAEQAYKYAIKHGLNDEVLLSEIWDAQAAAGVGSSSY